LAVLPRQSAVRKINELVKRIRKVKTLAYIIGHLKAEMPALVGKDKKQKKLINDLPNGTWPFCLFGRPAFSILFFC
jgi:EH domain-containing protein 1